MRTIPAAALALALLSAAPASAQDIGDIAAGRDYYAESCAECHQDPAAVADGLEQSDPAAIRAELEEFLPGHFAEQAADRANVIAYLLSI